MAWKKKDKKKPAPPAFENIEGLLEESGVAKPEATTEPAAMLEEPVPEEPAAKARRAKKERKPRVGSSEGSGLAASMGEASPYTVMLAISLAAILIAILYLAMEFGTYGFDHKAKEAKQQASVPASARLFDPTHAEIA